MSGISIRKSSMKGPQASPKAAKVNRRLGIQGIAAGLLVASGVGLAGWRFRDEITDLIPRDEITIDNSRKTVLFVVNGKDQTMSIGQNQAAGSQLVRMVCDKAGVEYRRYSVTADLSKEEGYIRKMHEIGCVNNPPCIVLVDTNHVVTVLDIPNTVSKTVEAIKEFCNV